MKDQEIAAGTVCDWSQTAHSAEAAYALIDRALVEFDTKRPRSKHIQVPIAQLEAQAAPAAQPKPIIHTGPAPRAADIAQAVTLLQQAKKPMLVFGGGAKHAAEAAREILRKTGAASVTTYAGRGVVAPDTALHFGSCLARPDSAVVMAEADLVLAVGTELVEVDLWRPHLGHVAPMIRVDLDPEVLCDPQGAEYPVLSDAKAFLTALADALPEATAHSGWSRDQVAATRARWRAETDAERPGIVPICDALRAVVPADTMIYSDMTQFAYVAKEVWDMPQAGHWHHPYGFGTLGYATPAAIGGAVARRGKPTMAIIGDYGFHYTMQELGVAVELGLSLPIILWDNGKLKEIEDSMVRAQIAPNAVIAQNPDFVKLAQAFGANACAPATLSELQKALSDAFDAEGPTLIYLTPAVSA
jgi:acetolactate synthase-1/2/3 large subunit/5-guanidino-2-oxopentanoate decarboxylase